MTTPVAKSERSAITLLVLVALTMAAFAANSILNRVAVDIFDTDPFDFAAIRVLAGASMLSLLVALHAGRPITLRSPMRVIGAMMLATYMVGFSFAYVELDAGIGALILFGVLQVVVFGWAVATGEKVPVSRWMGALIALVGLGVLLWPEGDAALPLISALAMTLAGIGWAVYTLLGRSEADALAATAGNFILCGPITVLAMLVAGDASPPLGGAMAGIVSGAVTSGLGYALWYRLVPKLPTTMAGIAQLSVPLIAIVAGTLFLDEAITWRLLMATAMVLGGIAMSLVASR
ncbi:MAG: DMT family transporter [Pseudomonadota bacterium]